MQAAEEISLVLLLLIVIGSVALTLSLTFLHPKYRELKPRLILSTKMLGVPVLAYGLLRTLTDLPLARFDIFLGVLIFIYILEMLFFFTVMRHPRAGSFESFLYSFVNLKVNVNEQPQMPYSLPLTDL